MLNVKKFSFVFLVMFLQMILFFTVCSAKESYEKNFNAFQEYLEKHNQRDGARFIGVDGEGLYSVTVHSPKVLRLLKNNYTNEDKKNLQSVMSAACNIKVLKKPWGSFVQAASFENEDIASSTNYDAVWVRDSIWAYLALNADVNRKKEAKEVLLTMVDYFATKAQVERMQKVILNPELIKGAEGQMNAVHIRFNANSEKFEDVFIDGKAQVWNHKQNDALGLLLDAVFTAVSSGEIKTEELTGNDRMSALVYMVDYLKAIKFYQMEDSGAWEEDARLNTSSVALVTSALENLQFMGRKNSIVADKFSKAFWGEVNRLKLQSLNQESLQNMIDSGYALINKQLTAGGESPGYAVNDTRYRTADAALLNLIYPAKLSKLTLEQKKKVLEIVKALVGDFGVKRYANDNYQAANYWYYDIKTDVDEKSFDARKKMFIKGTEAQWFFDSWYAKACMMLYRESGEKKYMTLAIKHFNRSLSQTTSDEKTMIGADGKDVPLFALPESYNFIEKDGRLWEVPSPITPLNWAKASMLLMFDEYQGLK